MCIDWWGDTQQPICHVSCVDLGSKSVNSVGDVNAVIGAQRGNEQINIFFQKVKCAWCLCRDP